MTKLNPEIKARWVAALRSGNYSKGTGELRSADDLFCCLGVLCDLQTPAGWNRPDAEGSYNYQFGGDADFELPPKCLRSVWGFDWDEVRVKIGCSYDTLYNHNDIGCTFEQIADAIEEQL